MKTWVFWLLVISMTARVTCYSTATVHFIPLMVWKGLSEGAAATLLGAFALINLVAHFLLGWIADRVNKPKLLAALPFSPGAFSAAPFCRFGLLATLAVHDDVHFFGRVVSDHLGNRGRFFWPAQFRDDPRHDEFLLYVGKLRRSRHGGRDLRPHPELFDGLVDLARSAAVRHAFGFVPHPSLDKAHGDARAGRLSIE